MPIYRYAIVLACATIGCADPDPEVTSAVTLDESVDDADRARASAKDDVVEAQIEARSLLYSYRVNASLGLSRGERGGAWAWCDPGDLLWRAACSPYKAQFGLDRYGDRRGFWCQWVGSGTNAYTVMISCAQRTPIGG